MGLKTIDAKDLNLIPEARRAAATTYTEYLENLHGILYLVERIQNILNKRGPCSLDTLKKNYGTLARYFSNFLNDAKNKKFIYVNSNVTTVRSYMYSDDLVNWLLKIALNSRISCPIYNVGSDQKISINKLAIMIGKKLKKPVKFSKKNSKKIDKYVPNISKAKKQLNFR